MSEGQATPWAVHGVHDAVSAKDYDKQASTAGILAA
jgi:hypothetical protein